MIIVVYVIATFVTVLGTCPGAQVSLIFIDARFAQPNDMNIYI